MVPTFALRFPSGSVAAILAAFSRSPRKRWAEEAIGTAGRWIELTQQATSLNNGRHRAKRQQRLTASVSFGTRAWIPNDLLRAVEATETDQNTRWTYTALVVPCPRLRGLGHGTNAWTSPTVGEGKADCIRYGLDSIEYGAALPTITVDLHRQRAVEEAEVN